MKAHYLPEPELEFGRQGRHIDPRQGIRFYGPADISDVAKQVRVAIIGAQAHIDGVKAWLDSAREPIAAKDSPLRHLHQPFPGFSPDGPFAAEIVFDPRLERPIGKADLAALTDANPLKSLARAVDLYDAELAKVADEPNVDVVLICRPQELDDTRPEPETAEKSVDAGAPTSGQPSTDNARQAPMPTGMDFHSLLKARALAYRKPIQIVRRGTWDGKFRDKTRSGSARQRQDEATRAWNLHTALYYKAGNVPWRLARESSDFTTLYVGVTFYRSRDDSELRTSVAQVFNERGDGVIVRGAKATVADSDRQPHLSEADAYGLLTSALDGYFDEHRNNPARVVLHKTSDYTDAELDGFHSAAHDRRLGTLELMWLTDSSIRLFRDGYYPPLRGTLLSLDKNRHALYTRGSVPAYQVYPGMYVPTALGLVMVDTETAPSQLASEVLELSKMNWNATPLDGRLPITVRTARSVGDILRHVPTEQRPASRYAFYM